MFKHYLLPAAAIVLIVLCANVRAESIVNGDFENTTGWGTVGSTNFPAEWGEVALSTYKNGAVQQTSPVIGGSVSAFMPADPVDPTNCQIRQVIDTPVTNWVFEFDFASEDPGGAADRSLHLSWGIGADNYNVIARIVDTDDDGDGDLEIYEKMTSPNGYKVVLADAVQFSADVESALKVHHMKVVGHMDLASPTYDVYITDSLGAEHSATGLKYYYYAVAQDEGFSSVQFDTGYSTGDYVLDNVSVHAIPEPSTLALLGAGLIGLLAYAWRKRK